MAAPAWNRAVQPIQDSVEEARRKTKLTIIQFASFILVAASGGPIFWFFNGHSLAGVLFTTLLTLHWADIQSTKAALVYLGAKELNPIPNAMLNKFGFEKAQIITIPGITILSIVLMLKTGFAESTIVFLVLISAVILSNIISMNNRLMALHKAGRLT